MFLAEISGDKLLYATGVPAVRYRTAPILLGMPAAFAAKTGAAVSAGLTWVNFFAIAYAAWRRPDRGETGECGVQAEHRAARAAAVSFAAIFYSERGDIGQITTASLVARFGMPRAIRAAAVAAMATKGAPAASAGAGLGLWTQRRLKARTMGYAAAGALLVLGLLSLMEVPAGREVAAL